MTATPSPIPGIVDGTPLDAWAVWTELVIPLLSALGTIAVAGIGVWVTFAFARREAAERERARRADYAVEVQGALSVVEEEVASGVFDTNRIWNAFRVALQTATLPATDDAPDLAKWIKDQLRRIIGVLEGLDAEPTPGDVPDSDGWSRDKRFMWALFGGAVRGRVAAWVRTGEFDTGPVVTDDGGIVLRE